MSPSEGTCCSKSKHFRCPCDFEIPLKFVETCLWIRIKFPVYVIGLWRSEAKSNTAANGGKQVMITNCYFNRTFRLGSLGAFVGEFLTF